MEGLLEVPDRLRVLGPAVSGLLLDGVVFPPPGDILLPGDILPPPGDALRNPVADCARVIFPFLRVPATADCGRRRPRIGESAVLLLAARTLFMNWTFDLLPLLTLLPPPLLGAAVVGRPLVLFPVFSRCNLATSASKSSYSASSARWCRDGEGAADHGRVFCCCSFIRKYSSGVVFANTLFLCPKDRTFPGKPNIGSLISLPWRGGDHG